MKKVKIYTTFAILKNAGACAGRYKLLAKKMGGINKYGRNTPINLITILDLIGTDDMLWCLANTGQQHETISRLMAADFAESVLYIFEKHHPKDDRPRKTIKAARDFANGKITADELAYSRAYARHAADFVVSFAVGSAAYAAAHASSYGSTYYNLAIAGTTAKCAVNAYPKTAEKTAERKKQEIIIRKYLTD